MAVPKKKTSKSRRDMRRSHDFLQYTAAVEVCENCGELHRRHNACTQCGIYRGRQVLPAAE